MKARKVMFLLFSLVCFGQPLLALAEDGFTAREIARSNYVFLQVGNQKGWLVVEVSEKDELRTVLLGPAGYRRDLTSFMPLSEVNKGTYAAAVSDDGTVYFETTSFTNEGVVMERKLFSLSRDSEEVSFIANLTQRGSISSYASVNGNGDMLIVEFDDSGLNDTIGVHTLGGVVSSQRSLSFPNRIQRGKSAIGQYLDRQGRFLITREQVTKHRRKLVDICSGALQSDAISCATVEQIAKLAYRGKGYISAFSEGKLLTESGPRFNLVDINTFDVTKSFRLSGLRNVFFYSVGQDLSIVGINSLSQKKPIRTDITVVDPLLGGQRYSCDFIPKESRDLLPFTQILKPSSSIMYLVIDGYDDTSNQSFKVLYELSLSETGFPNSPVVGDCSVTKKRQF